MEAVTIMATYKAWSKDGYDVSVTVINNPDGSLQVAMSRNLIARTLDVDGARAWLDEVGVDLRSLERRIEMGGMTLLKETSA